MQIKVTQIPPHKLGDAYDAGKASLTPRDVVRVDDQGFPLINPRHGSDKTARGRRDAATQKWVSWSGHVVHVRLTAGAGRPRGSDPAREQQVTQRMHAAKAIRYGTCPLRDSLSLMWVPAELRNQEPCAPRTYGEAKCCPHVEQIIKLRGKAHERIESKRAQKYKDPGKMAVEQNYELTKALIEQLNKRPAPTVVEGGE